ncbi:hypothetical protein AVEN_99678-1 [Araneus ventricosus]|uniref:Reverse transcriptase zinc-binding domain-containing protein n=1 Tax=Araneus ventricosus TaxID=182803 RepID=A0A4Y2DQC0_ARAVE|nr:hypothetical protein AVEN_99678-1 [Araneus ventricosus]
MIKCLTAPRWGANASNLLRICNACITQSIEYGAHTVGMTNKTGYAALKIIQNNILRFVFGLPRWTPLPILYKISNEINMQLRKSVSGPNHPDYGSDASKNENSTAIVAINCFSDVVIKGTIHNINSVFSGEGFAITLAVTSFVKENGDYLILTDKLSNLTALKYFNFHSPKSSLFLARAIFNALKICSSLELIYTPAHAGIAENERADFLAKQALTSPNICDWISPEDARLACFKITRKIQYMEWENSKYYDKYRWLNDFYFKKFNLSRRKEVLIFLLISRTLPINANLHKCRLMDSQNCIHCQVPETCEHVVLSCPKYETARDSLRAKLGCIPLSLDWICDFSVKGCHKIKAILAFIVSSGRF